MQKDGLRYAGLFEGGCMIEKYRAWDTKNKRMISAEELGNEKDCHVMLLNPLTGKFWHVELQCSFDPFENNDLIPIKCTGHNDKKDKEICQGDILQVSQYDTNPYNDHTFGPLINGKKVVVVWDEDDCSFGLYRVSEYIYFIELKKESQGNGLDLCYYGLCSINHEIHIGNYAEIIGNIYENPELLNESD